MKLVLKDNRRFVLRFDKNELLLQGIADFMDKQKIQACSFSAVGTATEVELGHYNAFIKDFRRKRFLEDFEISGLTGNGAIFETDSKPIIHAHGIFSRQDFTSVSGHIFEAKVLATCEVFLIQLDGAIKRKNNPDYNLNLLE